MFDDVARLAHESLAAVAGDAEHGYSPAPPPLHQHRARFWVGTDVDQFKLDAERFSTPANVDAVWAVLELVQGHAVVSHTRWMHELGQSYRALVFFLRR